MQLLLRFLLWVEGQVVAWILSIDGGTLLNFFDTLFLDNLFNLVFQDQTVLLNEHALLLLSKD